MARAVGPRPSALGADAEVHHRPTLPEIVMPHSPEPSSRFAVDRGTPGGGSSSSSCSSGDASAAAIDQEGIGGAVTGAEQGTSRRLRRRSSTSPEYHPHQPLPDEVLHLFSRVITMGAPPVPELAARAASMPVSVPSRGRAPRAAAPPALVPSIFDSESSDDSTLDDDALAWRVLPAPTGIFNDESSDEEELDEDDAWRVLSQANMCSGVAELLAGDRALPAARHSPRSRPQSVPPAPAAPLEALIPPLLRSLPPIPLGASSAAPLSAGSLAVPPPLMSSSSSGRRPSSTPKARPHGC